MGININPYDGSKRPPPPPNPPLPPKEDNNGLKAFRDRAEKTLLLMEHERLVEALKPLARAADKAEARLAERRERNASAHMSPSAHCGWGIKYRHALRAREVLKELGVNYND